MSTSYFATKPVEAELCDEATIYRGRFGEIDGFGIRQAFDIGEIYFTIDCGFGMDLGRNIGRLDLV